MCLPRDGHPMPSLQGFLHVLLGKLLVESDTPSMPVPSGARKAAISAMQAFGFCVC
jgi:hypothetical protein